MDPILSLVRKYYTEIYKQIGDENGIPIMAIGGDTLYISKKFSEVFFFKKQSNEISHQSYQLGKVNRMDVIIEVGKLNRCISDVSRKQVFFNSIMEIMRINNEEKSA